MIHLAWVGFLVALSWWIDNRYASAEHPKRRAWWMVAVTMIGLITAVTGDGWWLALGLIVTGFGLYGFAQHAEKGGFVCWAERRHLRTVSIRTVTIWSQSTLGELLAQDGPTTRIYCERCGKDLP